MLACELWVDPDTLTGGRDEQQADAAEIATDLLYVLTARQFPGICEATFRPNHTCPFECPGGLLDLGLRVVSVEQVLIDGDAVPSDEYEVRENRWIVRLPTAADPDVPQTWPCWQRLNLPDTADGTWSIRVRYGDTPPAPLVRAATVYANEVLKAVIDPGECNLPSRVTNVVREGLSMSVLDPQDFLEDGKTGIYEVDMAVAAYNPSGLTSEPAVINPDRLITRMRASTSGGS